MARYSNARLTGNAQKLRREMTWEERRLWYDFLKPMGIQAHRQKTIGEFIVDFYIPRAKLVIELDGCSILRPRGSSQTGFGNGIFANWG